MGGLIATGTSAFATAMGFPMSDVITFVQTQIQVMIGMGLGMFASLLPTIIAIAAIGAILTVIWRGLRFFHLF